MAGPCKPCNSGPNGRAGRNGEVNYGPPLNSIELPVQAETTVADSARVFEEQPEGCVRGFEKREEIVECPGCPVKACA